MRATSEEVRRKLIDQAAVYMNMDHIKTYTVTVTPTEHGYRAVCPALPECEAVAPTGRQALERVEDKIRARITGAIARREPIPVDRTSVKFLWMNLEEFLV